MLKTKQIILKSIKFYQNFFSPLLGKHCRFWPTCSEYTIKSIEKYGITKGSFKGFKRVLRCNPFNQGGIDLP
ncbi:MAG: membrane protein insertion efficiency factor YidD [Patescibacteria group bacterium]|nr:membrane protein insertion efficiency factor YidD [Patescibacteria group bacterium]